MKQALATLLFSLVLIQTLVGCQSSDTALVEGKVTFDGAPVESGLVVFQPQDGRTAGAPIVNGQYSLQVRPGAVPGVNQVKITWLKKTGKKWSPPPPIPAGTLVDEEFQVIPEKYNEKSTLTVDLKPGRNLCDFALTK